MVVSTVGFITSLTELTSNTATTSTAIPIMASLAQGIEVHPLLLLIPTALAASCAFMLPISTPPNAIVYGSRRVPIIKMIIAGVWLDILSIMILTLLVLSFGRLGLRIAWRIPRLGLSMNSLTDRVAVITGAAGVLGQATVRRFKECGALIIAVDCDAGTA